MDAGIRNRHRAHRIAERGEECARAAIALKLHEGGKMRPVPDHRIAATAAKCRHGDGAPGMGIECGDERRERASPDP